MKVYITHFGLIDPWRQTYLDELQSNSLQQSLTVLQNEQLVESYWFETGYIASHAVIDDLYVFVIGYMSRLINSFHE